MRQGCDGEVERFADFAAELPGEQRFCRMGKSCCATAWSKGIFALKPAATGGILHSETSSENRRKIPDQKLETLERSFLVGACGARFKTRKRKVSGHPRPETEHTNDGFSFRGGGNQGGW